MPSILFCRMVRFKAVHHYQLPHLNPEENLALFGSASQPHLHEWALTVWLKAPINEETGMAVDLVSVDQVLQERVVARFDHCHFREADPYFTKAQPTTEVLASYLFQMLEKAFAPAALVRLRIAESDDLWAEYHP